MKNDGLFAYHLQRPNWIIEEGASKELAFVFGACFYYTSFSCHLHKHIRVRATKENRTRGWRTRCTRGAVDTTASKPPLYCRRIAAG